MSTSKIKAAHLTLLAVILNKMKFYNMLYIFPTQETLLGYFNETLGQDRCLRSFNYYTRDLEDDTYLKRIRRSHNDPVLGHVFQSTIYIITNKGYRVLERLGFEAFKTVKKIKRALSKLKKKPSRKAVREGKAEKPESLKRVMDLVKDHLKTI